jgi:hypothetical protein
MADFELIRGLILYVMVGQSMHAVSQCNNYSFGIRIWQSTGYCIIVIELS